jgi:DNA polymerase (family 10)
MQMSDASQETRSRIARILREIAVLLRISGGDQRFKVRAYERAAYALEHSTRDVGEMIAHNDLQSVPGIGERLAGTIEEIWRTGRCALRDRLQVKFPPGTIELIDVPHLGIKKIETLHRVLGITTRSELKAACEAHEVQQVPGFGAALERKILTALSGTDEAKTDCILLTAMTMVEPLLAYVRSCVQIDRADVVGAIRRREEVISTLEIVAATNDPAYALDHFLRYPSSIETVERTENAATLRLLRGPLAMLHVTSLDAYVNALHYFTGSAAHIDALQTVAAERELRLDAVALADNTGATMPVRDERDLYGHLGLQFIVPELRENHGEIEAAARGAIPEDLIRVADIQGITHTHTQYSDGKNTIAEMARAAERMGMRYLTITDHSPSAGYAGGLSPDRLRHQWDEIARVQEQVSIRLLRGTESDILRDGALDYADDLLRQFDVVIASIHARHHMSGTEMTQRIVRAMQHPAFKIWGHPLGRLLLSRPPFDCDVEHILDVIADARAAIEINGDPHRLDLEPRWIRAARRRGIKFVLSTDAHSVMSLRNVRFAVAMARRGWVARSEVLNTLPPDEFAAAVRPWETETEI